MPIKTTAFLCRGCGAIFRTFVECQLHESKCPEVASEKERLHEFAKKIHVAEPIREPHPKKTIHL